MLPLMIFAGAFIIFMAGFFTGMWLLGLHYQEKEEKRERQQQEYAEYLLNPDKKERTDFNFNGEGGEKG
jgi:type II secretory pathway component PulL